MAAVPRLRRPLLTAAAGTVAAGGAVLAWSAGYEVRAFRLRRVTVPVLAPDARPLRVLHLSDLHLVPSQGRKRAFVRSLAGLEPDLVVDTGDNLAAPDAVPAILEDLGPLLDRPGAFVLGSNDYFAPRPKSPLAYLAGPSAVTGRLRTLPADALAAGLRDAGWCDLTNAQTTVEVAGRSVSLAGVDDPHLRRDRHPAGVPDPDADLRLGVLHAPYRRPLGAMVAEGNDLVLAGHTHGGQVCVPFVGALTTNCDLPLRYASGLHTWRAGGQEAWLHVSAGLGTSPYAPVRLACPPEATLLTLVPGPGPEGPGAASREPARTG
jgi:uncharacterized protein